MCPTVFHIIHTVPSFHLSKLALTLEDNLQRLFGEKKLIDMFFKSNFVFCGSVQKILKEQLD